MFFRRNTGLPPKEAVPGSLSEDPSPAPTPDVSLDSGVVSVAPRPVPQRSDGRVAGGARTPPPKRPKDYPKDHKPASERKAAKKPTAPVSSRLATPRANQKKPTDASSVPKGSLASDSGDNSDTASVGSASSGVSSVSSKASNSSRRPLATSKSASSMIKASALSTATTRRTHSAGAGGGSTGTSSSASGLKAAPTATSAVPAPKVSLTAVSSKMGASKRTPSVPTSTSSHNSSPPKAGLGSSGSGGGSGPMVRPSSWSSSSSSSSAAASKSKAAAAASQARAKKAEEKHRLRAEKAQGERNRARASEMELKSGLGAPLKGTRSKLAASSSAASAAQRRQGGAGMGGGAGRSRRASVTMRSRSSGARIGEAYASVEGDEAMAMADAIMGAIVGDITPGHLPGGYGDDDDDAIDEDLLEDRGQSDNLATPLRMGAGGAAAQAGGGAAAGVGGGGGGGGVGGSLRDNRSQSLMSPGDRSAMLRAWHESLEGEGVDGADGGADGGGGADNPGGASAGEDGEGKGDKPVFAPLRGLKHHLPSFAQMRPMVDRAKAKIIGTPMDSLAPTSPLSVNFEEEGEEDDEEEEVVAAGAAAAEGAGERAAARIPSATKGATAVPAATAGTTGAAGGRQGVTAAGGSVSSRRLLVETTTKAVAASAGRRGAAGATSPLASSSGSAAVKGAGGGAALPSTTTPRFPPPFVLDTPTSAGGVLDTAPPPPPPSLSRKSSRDGSKASRTRTRTRTATNSLSPPMSPRTASEGRGSLRNSTFNSDASGASGGDGEQKGEATVTPLTAEQEKAAAKALARSLVASHEAEKEGREEEGGEVGVEGGPGGAGAAKGVGGRLARTGLGLLHRFSSAHGSAKSLELDGHEELGVPRLTRARSLIDDAMEFISSPQSMASPQQDRGFGLASPLSGPTSGWPIAANGNSCSGSSLGGGVDKQQPLSPPTNNSPTGQNFDAGQYNSFYWGDNDGGGGSANGSGQKQGDVVMLHDWLFVAPSPSPFSSSSSPQQAQPPLSVKASAGQLGRRVSSKGAAVLSLFRNTTASSNNVALSPTASGGPSPDSFSPTAAAAAAAAAAAGGGTEGWKEWYCVLIRGGGSGDGANNNNNNNNNNSSNSNSSNNSPGAAVGSRGLGSLLLLKAKPTAEALSAYAMTDAFGSKLAAKLLLKDGGKEISLNGADVGLRFDKAPEGTFGFLLTQHTRARGQAADTVDVPLAAKNRQERQKWLSALRVIVKSNSGSAQTARNSLNLDLAMENNNSDMADDGWRSSPTSPASAPCQPPLHDKAQEDARGSGRKTRSLPRPDLGDEDPASPGVRSPIPSLSRSNDSASPHSSPRCSPQSSTQAELLRGDSDDDGTGDDGRGDAAAAAGSAADSNKNSSLRVDVVFSDPPQYQKTPPASPHSAGSVGSGGSGNGGGGERSRSAPTVRPFTKRPSLSEPNMLTQPSPPGNGSDSSLLAGSGSLFAGAAAGPLQWRERMRRAAPAQIDDVDWGDLVALCTPDMLADLGGRPSVMNVNSGGAVFFAFFKPTPPTPASFNRHSENDEEHDDDANGHDDDANGDGNDDEIAQQKAEEEKKRKVKKLEKKAKKAKQKGAKKQLKQQGSPRAASARSSQDVVGPLRARTRVANNRVKFTEEGGDIRGDDREYENDDDDDEEEEEDDDDDDESDDDDNVEEGEDAEDGEDEDEEDESEEGHGVLRQSRASSSGRSHKRRVSNSTLQPLQTPPSQQQQQQQQQPACLVESVLILKFCQNMMDTQAEFSANQIAMALHVQVPACRLMRKKDKEWDLLAESAYRLRRSALGRAPSRTLDDEDDVGDGEEGEEEEEEEKEEGGGEERAAVVATGVAVSRSVDSSSRAAAAAAAFEPSEKGQQVAGTCDQLEESLHNELCGLVFEFVHTGQSVKLEAMWPALKEPYEQEQEQQRLLLEAGGTEEGNEDNDGGGGGGDDDGGEKEDLAGGAPLRAFLGGAALSMSLQPASETMAQAASVLNVEALDPTAIGLPASVSFRSAPIASALTGGVFQHKVRHRASTVLRDSPFGGTGNNSSSSSSSSLASSLNNPSSLEAAEGGGDGEEDNEEGRDSHGQEEEGHDEFDEFVEKDIGEIVGETLVFDIAIRNSDRFPCKRLQWRGNLDNMMWVERSKHSGSQTLWLIDSSIPRRPLRLHVKDDKTAIPSLLRTCLTGTAPAARGARGEVKPATEEAATRTTACLLYELLGGDPTSRQATGLQGAGGAGGQGEGGGQGGDLAVMEAHVPAFRRGVRACLRRCAVLLEGTLSPLQATLQSYFDQIGVELDALQKQQQEQTKALQLEQQKQLEQQEQKKQQQQQQQQQQAQQRPTKPLTPIRPRGTSNPTHSAGGKGGNAAAAAAAKKTASAVAAAANKFAAAGEASAKKKEAARGQPDGEKVAQFRPRFNTRDVRMFNLKKDERIDNDKLEEGGDEDADTAEAERPANETEGGRGRSVSNPTESTNSEPPASSEAEHSQETESETTAVGGEVAGGGGGDESVGSVKEGESSVVKEGESSVDKDGEAKDLTGRDATVAVINRWTRKFWEQGKELEDRFEEFLEEQELYQEQLHEAQEAYNQSQLALANTVDDVAFQQQQQQRDQTQGGGVAAGGTAVLGVGGVDEALVVAGENLAAAAAATTELVQHEPVPCIVTGFIDTGSTNCFAGAYELKIRLEHMNERMRLMVTTAAMLGEIDLASSSSAPPSLASPPTTTTSAPPL